jgi:hypothetical protein
MAKAAAVANPALDDRDVVDRAPDRSTPPPEAPPMVPTPDDQPRRDDPQSPQPAPPPPAEPTRPAAPDPFDPATLRLGADYAEGLGVRKVISTIPNRKPNKSEWFRVRPGEEWRLQTAVLELEKGVERSTYLVAPSLWPDLSGEITPALLLTCVNRAGDLFLWRVKLPGADGRSNTWTDSALQIAKAAEDNWARMVSDTANGIYTHYEPSTDLPDPRWPSISFREIIRIAFRDRMIESLDHPVIRELRGDA